jgi:hypothetical protein
MGIIAGRKLHHVTVLLIFAPAMLCDRHLLQLAQAIALWLMVLVECARAWRAKYIASALDALVLHQRSTLDQGSFILTPIALLFACMAGLPLLHQGEGRYRNSQPCFVFQMRAK